MDSDVVDLSVKKGGSSTMPNQNRSSSGRGRRDIVSPDISLPLPFAFNQFVGNNNVIPQVQVPHDLTRLVSMLRERDELNSTISTSSNRDRSASSAHQLTSILLPQMNLSANSGNSTNSRKQSSTTNSNLKRKRPQHQHQDADNFCLPQSQFTSPTHPVRRSLRPRAERSYAESPDIVVDYEEEPPAKLNGIASTNGNGHFNEGDDTSGTDSDCGEMPPLPVIKELSPEEVEEREKLLEALREQVRNEETKLVLLKKIRQSQIMKENLCIPQSTSNNLANNVSQNSTHTPSSGSSPSPLNNHSSSPNMTGFNMSSGIKGRSSPKLPSGNNHLGSISQGNSNRHLQSSPNKILGSSSKVPSLLKGQPPPTRGSNSNQAHTPISNLMMPPQRNSPNQLPHNLLIAQQSLLRGSRGNLPQSATNMMLNYGSNPPGAIPAPTISPALDKYDRPKDAHSGPNTSSQQLFSNSNIVDGKINNVSLSTGPAVSGPATSVSAPMSTLPKSSIGVPLTSTVDQAERRHRLATPNEEERETPAQRQAAAKLALRKQLEKTLLQIPPPKPPPPEMNFIPNPSNMEFLALIGLEFVVDYITRDRNTPTPPPDAVTCIQCETDFSSMWKLDKGKIICDQCATSNAKKSLKAEHTNRLKTAFVQALQQEQEIEQRLAQGGSLSETLGSVTNSLGRNESSPSPSHTPNERDRHSPQVSAPSDRVARNRTPTQSPGLVPVQLSLPVRDRDREREHKDREREAQREIEKAMAAAMSSAHSSHRERENNRERSSRANNDTLNLSAHSQHSFTQQLKHEMAQLAQMHEQQLQQQQQQLQLSKHNSRGSTKNNNSNMMNSRGDKREKERDAYRDRGDSGHSASSLLSMTLGHSMANQLLSQNIQNLTMGQVGSSGGNHSNSQKSSSSQSSSRRPRNADQSHKQSNMSKQQKLDAEAAAKFASALGMSGSGSSSSLNPSAVAAAAALQAAHQQMLRMPQNQQHLLPFSPLLYPYQMMAQAGKPVTPASLAELQRQAENLQQLQRQYLLDMIPNSRNLPQNWKT